MVNRRQRRARAAVQLVAGLGLLGSAGLLAATGGQRTDSSPPAAVVDSPTQFGATDGVAAPSPASPYRLVIPTLSVDAPIVSVEIGDDGVLGVPADPAAVGWWADGPVPGSGLGTSVLAGHVNTADRGPGALRSIDALQPGDQLSVVGWAQPVNFAVEQIVRYPRAAVPPTAFDQRVPGRIAIVSCSELDARTGTYLDNIIVYARRTDATAPPATISFDTSRMDTGS